VTVGRYTGDPVGTPGFEIAGSYFDVRASTPEAFSSVTIVNCDLAGGTAVHWWNPAGGPNGSWEAVSNQSYSAGPPACVTVTIGSTTSPSLAELTGTVFVASAPSPVSTTAATSTATATPTSGTSETAGTPAAATNLAYTGTDVRRFLELALVLLVSGVLLMQRTLWLAVSPGATRRRRRRGTPDDD